MTMRKGPIPLNTLDDSFLIQHILEGNANAFRFLVLRYQRPIFKYLTCFGLPQPVTEELAQETFARAYKNQGLPIRKRRVIFNLAFRNCQAARA